MGMWHVLDAEAEVTCQTNIFPSRVLAFGFSNESILLLCSNAWPRTRPQCMWELRYL